VIGEKKNQKAKKQTKTRKRKKINPPAGGKCRRLGGRMTHPRNQERLRLGQPSLHYRKRLRDILQKKLTPRTSQEKFPSVARKRRPGPDQRLVEKIVQEGNMGEEQENTHKTALGKAMVKNPRT